MGYDVFYDPAAPPAGQMAYGAGFGQMSEDRQQQLDAIDRFNQQMAQQAALQSQELGYRDLANQRQIGAQYANNAQELAAQQQGQLNYAAAQGQNQVQAAGIQGAAQMARDIQQNGLKQALSEHDAIQKAWIDGDHFTSEEQFKQAKTAWENKWKDFGFGWGLPDQIAQQADQQHQQQQIAQLEAMADNPFSPGQSLLPPGAVKSMLEMGMPVDKVAGHIVKIQSEARQRQALEQKGKIDETKQHEAVANMQRDDQRAIEENARKWKEHEAQIAREQLAAQAEAKIKQDKAIAESQYKMWKAKFDIWEKGDAEGIRKGEPPNIEDFVKPITAQSPAGGGIKTISTQAEYDALPSGAEYIDAQNGQRERKP